MAEYIEYRDSTICVDWIDGKAHLTDLNGRAIHDDVFCKELEEDRNG